MICIYICPWYLWLHTFELAFVSNHSFIQSHLCDVKGDSNNMSLLAMISNI